MKTLLDFIKREGVSLILLGGKDSSDNLLLYNIENLICLGKIRVKI